MLTFFDACEATRAAEAQAAQAQQEEMYRKMNEEHEIIQARLGAQDERIKKDHQSIMAEIRSRLSCFGRGSSSFPKE